ncbi:MAG: glycerol-3-phosphate 1-O-acyltransferase PlsY [Neomegalonema sp.]|nr:glycerol-3-phosphate 1-O-acyltransferase PlsY [Neomegalonema sp.]
MVPDILNWGGAFPYFVAAFVGGYLIGGLPFGLWLGRAFGLGDVRAQGSGNIGAANLLRSGGWRVGLLTLLLDACKGAAPALIASEWGLNTMVLAGFGAFLGHCFSPYLGFWGGKGIATAFGVFVVWSAPIALMCVAVWIVAAALSRRASVASLATAAAGAALFPYFELWDAAWAVFAMGLITLWRHRGNVERLLRGDEPKIGARP